MILPAIAQAASLLVLDARPDAVCRARDGEDLVVCAADDRPTDIVPMRLNRAAGRLLIGAGGPERMVCNASFAARAGVDDVQGQTLAMVGPLKVSGWRGTAQVVALGRRWTQPVEWTTREPLDRADCVTGPRRLPFERVRFLIGPPRADATAVTLRFHHQAGHIYGALPVARETLAVRFEPSYARSLLTAPAAKAIVPVHGGTVTGRWLTEPIFYGVSRPIRQLRLHRPLTIGGMTLRDPFVRGDDYGSAMSLRSIDPAAVQEDDVIVSAKRGKPNGLKLLRVGADDLSHCVDLTVDKSRKEMTLTC